MPASVPEVLVRLGAEFSRLQAIINRLDDRMFALPDGHAALETTYKQIEALVVQQKGVSDRMRDIPAQTQAGVLAKARVAHEYFLKHHKEELEGDYADEDTAFVWSLINDVVTLGGRT